MLLKRFRIATFACLSFDSFPGKAIAIHQKPKENLQTACYGSGRESRNFHHGKSLNLKNARTEKRNRIEKNVYFSGTYIDERDAPIPGVPCLTGLLVIANSPR